MTTARVNIFKRSRYGYVWLHVAVWALQLILPFIVGTAANHFSIGSLPAAFFISAVFIHIGLFYGNAFFLYPKLYTLRRWLAYIVCAILLVAAIIWLKHDLLVHWFSIPHLDANMWRMIVAPTGVTFFASIVYRNVIDKIRAEKEKHETKEQALYAELKFLRSQISPHFIFNVLTNLVTLARKKSDQLEPSLLMLSGLMRYMLYDTDRNKIPLQQEIEYLENYISLQRMRYGSEMSIVSHIAVAATTETIEPMLLIPFVENAFKHGARFDGDAGIVIQLQLRENRLHFEVGNRYTKQMAEVNDGNSGIGIENVSARLRLLYGQKYTLDIIKTEELFTVKLMLLLI